MRSPRAAARSDGSTWLLGAAIAVALVPLVVSAVAVLLHGDGAFIRDQALMEMSVRDVAHHPVLIGLYSRDGWSHPGPLISYTLAPFYWLAGESPSGMLVGALAINGAAIAGMGVLARRLGGLPAALLVLLGAATVAHALGTQVLLDPWVCYVTVLPFGFFCVVAWAMVAGRAWAFPVAVALASWLTQTHVGYAPLTAPALVLGAGCLWWAARRSGDRERMRRAYGALGLGAGVLVVLWALPVWDQIFGTGNLGAVVRWFTAGGQETHTVAEGSRIVLGQLAVVPDWVTGTRRVGVLGETTLRTTTLWPVLLVLFVGAWVAAWKGRRGPLLQLAAVVTVTTLVAIVAVARTIGIMFEYRLLWTWIVGMLAGVVIVWSVWAALAERFPWLVARVLVPATMALIAVVAVAGLVDAAENTTPAVYSAATLRVTRELRDKLAGRPGQVVLASRSQISDGYLAGLLVALEREGVDARIASDPVGRFGHGRVQDDRSVQAKLVVLADGDLNAFTPPSNLELVAYSGPVSLARRAAIGAAQDAKAQRLLRQLRAGTITSRAYYDGIAGLRAPGPDLAVFEEVDPG
ncbi:MAG TPA: hypothetical protein VGN59_14085 [Acidimicrobiia bacterium]